MFENVLQTSVFLRILIIAFVTVLAVNLIAAAVDFGLRVYMKLKDIR